MKGDKEDRDTGHQGHGHWYSMFSQQIPYQKQALTCFGGKSKNKLLCFNCDANKRNHNAQTVNHFYVYVNMHGEKELEGTSLDLSV